jgi:hypothetical protein
MKDVASFLKTLRVPVNIASILVCALLSLVSAMRVTGDYQAQSDKDYKFNKDSLPVPEDIISVKLVQDDQKTALKDFSLEIKNVSSKPIYYLFFTGSFPHTKKEMGGIPLGFVLTYGKMSKFHNGHVNADREDPSIKPGETIFLSLSEDALKGTLKAIEEKQIPASSLRKIEFTFQGLDFGDGSRYIAPDKAIKTSKK